MRNRMEGPDTLLVDLDGTTYNYPEYAAYTFRAMMHTIVEATDRDEEEVVAAMREHYMQNGIESPSLLQTLKTRGFFQDLDMQPEQHSELRQQVRKAFNAAKTNHLRPYPGILPVLKSARDQDRQVIALTDAQSLSTISKLNAHQTSHIGPEHFSRLVAIRDRAETSLEDLNRHVDRLKGSLSIPLVLIDREKPNTDLESLLGMTPSEIAARVGILDDNYHRGMNLAMRYDMRGYHALWGVLDLARHEDTIERFSGGSGPIPRSFIPPIYPDRISPVGQPEGLYELWGLERPDGLK